MNNFIYDLALVGFCALFFAVAVLGNIALDEIDFFIWKKKREYQYKHRFDKPPKAKCYCIDCARRDEEGRCYELNRWVSDDNFCWDAEPRICEVKRNE